MPLHSSVAYWENNSGGYLFAWSADDKLKAFKRNGNGFVVTPSSTSNVTALYPGGMLTVSSNDTLKGTGIVWANIAASGDANGNAVPGILRAFDASDVSKEIWNSEQNKIRDPLGNYAKFNAPIVVNGKVYEPTFSKQLVVYGLNPPVKYLDAIITSKIVKGINYYYYKGNYTSLPNFNSLKPIRKDSVHNFEVDKDKDSINFAVSYQGYINIDQKDLYTFYLNSKDGSELFVDNYNIILNDGVHQATELNGSVGLKPGMHSLRINYFHGSVGSPLLGLSYSTSNLIKQIIPDSALYRDSIVLTNINELKSNYNDVYLHQNIPNPATGNTKIYFGVNVPQKVIITLYNMQGVQLQTLFNDEICGEREIEVNINNLMPGIYIYKMISKNLILNKSLIVK